VKTCGTCHNWHQMQKDQGCCVEGPPTVIPIQRVVPPTIVNPGAGPQVEMQIAAFYPPVKRGEVGCRRWTTRNEEELLK